ncbi:hypothetical protein ACIPWF_22660 [Paenarthrobacter sp. NPDC089989]|uniref:hypothetical protein n=1 Tax=unclassified Paenarthrobacter TaxID=2634190 RepID=UPI0037F260AD
MKTLQTFPGISLNGIFPGLPAILDRLILVLAIVAIIGTLYTGTRLMLAFSRGTLESSGDGNGLFHAGFIAAICAPFVGLTVAGMPGLVTGTIAGATIALATAWAWRRHRTTPSEIPD